jgi:hypothetical protein
MSEALIKGIVFALGMMGIAFAGALVLVAGVVWWSGACSDVGIFPIC